MTSSLLLDTNVWLDYYLPTRAGHAAAARVVTFAHDHQTPLLYAIHSVNDVCYIVGRTFRDELRRLGYRPDKTSHEVTSSMVEDVLSDMQTIATAVGADASDLWLAKRYHRIHPDYEDCLVLAAVERSGARCLISNDRSLLRHAPCLALSPEEYLAIADEGPDGPRA